MNTLIGMKIRRLVSTLGSATFALLVGPSWAGTAAAPPIQISQIPLTISIPAHPQIMLILANSESMDGTLSGAIMTGSGSLGAAYSGLNSSSSPVNFTVPSGFTPPLNAGAGGSAPYTVTVSSTGATLYDNSPSRLNVAKAGLSAILSSYFISADFALMDYTTNGNQLYNTWVYQMSPPGGFTFTSKASASGQVANPCYQIDITQSNSIATDCAALNSYYSGQNILNQPYVNVSASSDNPTVNDVFYDPGMDPICLSYSGPNPGSPYSSFTLADFNADTITLIYNSWLPDPTPPDQTPPNTGTCWDSTYMSPTNAGYVAYSPEVLFEQRGFGYGANQSPTGGTVLVPMTSAGSAPTNASVTAAIAAFTPFLAPETNSLSTNEIKAESFQSPIAGLIAQANTYFASNPPSTSGCIPERYVILVSDGLPTEDLSGNYWPPLGSAAAAAPPNGYGVSASFNPDGSLGTTNDQALTDAISTLSALNAAGVKTFIIGVGAGVDPSLNPVAAQTLTAMAIAGGTGSYFPATSPLALTNDLQSILSIVLVGTQSLASVAVNSTGLSNNSVVYQSQFLSSDTYLDWTGNLYAFPVNSSGVVDTVPADALWSAATQLDAQSWDSGRLIATWDPVAQAGIPFRWNASATATVGIASNTVLGQDLTTFTPDPNGLDALDYLRGSSAQEVRNGGQFRNRTHKLGDIVFSNPAYVGPPSGNYLSSSYLQFAKTNASRPAEIYVGADDGMLHAFDAATGTEHFAYIPTGVYSNLINLVSPYYNAHHLFYVDGSPKVADVQFADATWHSVLIGTEGAGGNSVFALDVTNPSTISNESLLASAVLWDFTDPDLGLTYSNPVVANYGTGQIVLIGNGYNSTHEKPFLYALNPQTGAIYSSNGDTAKIDLCAAVPTACNLAAANGLSSVIAVNSAGQASGPADTVYAGDLQGNLWRINIGNTDPSQWTVSVLFQARDPSGNPQPITTAPVASLNPLYPQLPGSLVYVGTGQLLGVPDLTTNQVQSIYGVYDPTTPYATPLTRSNLVQQVLSSSTVDSTEVALATGNSVSLPATKGWYIDLTLNSGERVVNTPLIKSGALVVTTTQPSNSPCTAGGSSFLYVINYATGSSFASPQFSLTGGNTLSAPISGIVGVSLGGGFYANATIVNAALTAVPAGYYEIYSCGESGIGCTPRLLKGANKRRIAWWEVKQ